jgi:hypothetical protein
MVKLARAALTTLTKIEVTHIHQLTANEVALVYSDGAGEHVVDAFTAHPEVINTLLLVLAGHKVSAEIEPNKVNGTEQPICLSATDEGLRA